MVGKFSAHEEPASNIYVTISKKIHDCRIIDMPSSYKRPPTANPLISPHRVSEETKMALMGPKRREEYTKAQINKARRKIEAERFLCSCLMSRTTHDLLQHRAMEKGQPYDEAILECVSLVMKYEPELKMLVRQRRKLEEDE